MTLFFAVSAMKLCLRSIYFRCQRSTFPASAAQRARFFQHPQKKETLPGKRKGLQQMNRIVKRWPWMRKEQITSFPGR